jgi:hypothetical protein
MADGWRSQVCYEQREQEASRKLLSHKRYYWLNIACASAYTILILLAISYLKGWLP